jgi:hypothetical protein
MSTHRFFPCITTRPADGHYIILAVASGAASYRIRSAVVIEAKTPTTVRVWTGEIDRIGLGQLPTGPHDYYLIALNSMVSRTTDDSTDEKSLTEDPPQVTVTIGGTPVTPPPDIIVDFP